MAQGRKMPHHSVLITGECVVVVLLEVDLEDGALDWAGELLPTGRRRGVADDASAIQRFLRLLGALQAQRRRYRAGPAISREPRTQVLKKWLHKEEGIARRNVV
jgi:hypothetical protein